MSEVVIPKKYLAGVLLLLTLVLSAPCSAEWRKYENAFFIVYSQAKERKVRVLVQELEFFRAATLQTFTLRANDDSPKTVVFIAKNGAEFERLGGWRGIDGLARREGGQTFIIIRGAGRFSTNSNTVRHEYAHALLGYDDFDYPAWYAEGFAELASLVEIDDKAGAFVLGKGTDRHLGESEIEVSWNALIDDDFNPHRLASIRAGSAAYGQSWLLMHYLTLGPDAENGVRLARYVADIKAGTSSDEAFKSAFGKMPQDIWDEDMSDYSHRLPFYKIGFRGVELDEEFAITTAPPEELNSLLEVFMRNWRAEKSKRVRTERVDEFAGRWVTPKVNSQCKSPITVQRDTTAERLLIEWEADEKTGDTGGFVSYDFDLLTAGSWRLTQKSETGENHSVIPNFLISLREDGTMCLTHSLDRRSGCDVGYIRCAE